MDRVFFTNSGGEANEGALKAARRYAYTKKTGRYEFIAMQNSFHGRSFGAVSVTGHDSYREPFEPVVPGVRFAEFNDLDSVKALVMIRLVQLFWNRCRVKAESILRHRNLWKESVRSVMKMES